MYGIIGSGAGAVGSVALGEQLPGPAGQALAVTGFAFAAYVILAVGLILAGLFFRTLGRKRPASQG